MSEAYLPCEELDCPDARFSVIWLHGLGADGYDFVPVVPELRLPDSLRVRFVFPHAPQRPVTINGGYVMRAWYDILETGNLSRRLDEATIVESVAQIHALIRREISRGIPAERIVLIGFSQGGLVALTAGLSLAERLAGIVALSTYWPTMQEPALQVAPGSTSIPVFQAHGEFDPVVGLPLGRAAYERLVSLGQTVEWHDYMMEHEVCREQLRDLSLWLQARFSAV